MPSTTLCFGGPVSPGLTLGPSRRGTGDPCYRVIGAAIWRTSLLRTGPVTARITKTAPDTVGAEAWGPGASEFLDGLPAAGP